jgi:hypothetical protein
MGVPDALRDYLSDRYAVDRELGRGGMATGYLAHDLVRRGPGRVHHRHGEVVQFYPSADRADSLSYAGYVFRR